MTGSVAVFGSSQTIPDSADWRDAVHVGRRLAEAGLEVITGGYGGTMEAASLGASEAGGRVVGVTAPVLFPDRDALPVRKARQPFHCSGSRRERANDRFSRRLFLATLRCLD